MDRRPVERDDRADNTVGLEQGIAIDGATGIEASVQLVGQPGKVIKGLGADEHVAVAGDFVRLAYLPRFHGRNLICVVAETLGRNAHECGSLARWQVTP